MEQIRGIQLDRWQHNTSLRDHVLNWCWHFCLLYRDPSRDCKKQWNLIVREDKRKVRTLTRSLRKERTCFVTLSAPVSPAKASSSTKASTTDPTIFLPPLSSAFLFVWDCLNLILNISAPALDLMKSISLPPVMSNCTFLTTRLNSTSSCASASCICRKAEFTFTEYISEP